MKKQILIKYGVGSDGSIVAKTTNTSVDQGDGNTETIPLHQSGFTIISKVLIVLLLFIVVALFFRFIFRHIKKLVLLPSEHSLKKYQLMSLGICAILLFMAIPGIWPIGFYQIVHWIVFITCIYNIYRQKNDAESFWLFPYIFLAILFNPITPIHLSKSIWGPIDLIVAIFMLVAYIRIYRTIKTNNTFNDIQ